MVRTKAWTLAAVVIAALLASPAARSDAAPSADRAASAVAQRAVITFTKNATDPSSSVLTWQVERQGSDGAWSTVDQRSWRAGSGMLGRAGRNECAKGRGWLPDGTYRLRFLRDYHGSLIKGRAFRLDDHRCRNGRWRVQLFIHTEQGAHDTQCRNRPGDQVCRWEMPRINDYKSAGCIKLAPGDLADLSRHFLQYYKAGVRYPKSRVVVRVVEQPATAPSSSG
jgi:hypothetical protein